MSISQFDADPSGTAIPAPWLTPSPGPAPFEVRFSWTAGAMIVEVSGEIDIATAPDLAYALDRLQSPARRLVVDLSKVVFLDASCLKVLIRCRRKLAKNGIGFAVVAPSDCRAVRMVLDLTGLTEPLGVVGSLDEALAEKSTMPSSAQVDRRP